LRNILRIEIVLGKRGHGRNPESLTTVQIVEDHTPTTELTPITTINRGETAFFRELR